ncbi:MAG TPA: class I SAM-dependent methyltransferase [Vicinamibacterales bacterium]|jgi:SAM-dependent methyltransferase
MSLETMARRTVASLPPGIRWRTRNAVALVRWLRLRGAADTAYGEDFWALHDSGDWDGFAATIGRFCTPASIVDVGCGDAKLLAAMRRRQALLPMLGIDSSRTALDRAAAAGVPVLCHDIASMRAANLDTLRARVSPFDVAVSLETAEHLPPWAARRFVETLARVRLVVFSAAHPGQGGTLHLNERPHAYWRARFATLGYRLSASDEAFRAAIAALDLPSWYRANVHLYERGA